MILFVDLLYLKMNKMKPDLFTTREGGQLYPWDRNEIAEPDLIVIPVQRRGYIEINGAQVHSLIWLKDTNILEDKPLNYCGMHDIAARWDCLNGWTQGAAVAK